MGEYKDSNYKKEYWLKNRQKYLAKRQTLESKAARKAYERLNAENIKATRRAWKIKNHENILLQRKLKRETPEYKVKAKAYYEQTKERQSQQRKQRILANPNKEKARSKKWCTHLKSTVINQYGGRCANPRCNEDELVVLTIDHKNDDGNIERKKLVKENKLFYLTLYKQTKRDDLQVLCQSCQWRKRAYGPDFSKWPTKSYDNQILANIYDNC